MSGLVVKDGGGGDHYWTLVDDELWKQILDLRIHMDLVDASRKHPRTGEPCWNSSKYRSWVEALTCEGPDVDVPEGTPTRIGKILKSWSTQTYVVEAVALTDVVGILTLP